MINQAKVDVLKEVKKEYGYNNLCWDETIEFLIKKYSPPEPKYKLGDIVVFDNKYLAVVRVNSDNTYDLALPDRLRWFGIKEDAIPGKAP